MGRLGALRDLLELQREFRDELEASEALREQITGAIRPALEHLGEVDDRRLIAGESAQTGPEPLDFD